MVVVPVPQIVAPVVVVVADIQVVPIMVVRAETQHTRAAVRVDLPILRITGKAEAEVERICASDEVASAYAVSTPSQCDSLLRSRPSRPPWRRR